jgi:hypothetical protein
MTLGMSFQTTGEEGSSKREAFKRDVANDLARASSLPAENFKISKLSAGSVKRDLVSVKRDLSKLSAGSVIVDIDILPDPLGIAPAPFAVARDLEQQAADPNSPLRSGKLTSRTKGIQVLSPQRERPGGSGGGGGGVLGQDSDSGFSSDSFSGGRGGRELRRALAAPGSADAAMSDQHGTGGDRRASSDRPSPPGILISPREGLGTLVSRYPRSRSRSSDSREHREVTFKEPPHKWREADQDAAATLRQTLTPPPINRSPHLPPNSISRENGLFESAERESELVEKEKELSAAAATATTAAADEKRRTFAAAAAVAEDEDRMLKWTTPVLPAKTPSSDSQEGKQWRQPEAVRKLFLDRQRAIERYYLNFPVDDAVALTREAVKTGAVQPLLDFQRAELMALVDAYDRLVLENVFDAFDLDSDGVISEEEGTALLSLWLKGAHLHLLPVLHSLVAGLVSSKMRMVLAFGRDADQRNNANMWGQDSDVAWVLRSSAPLAFAL